jgi:hypothetical protein
MTKTKYSNWVDQSINTWRLIDRYITHSHLIALDSDQSVLNLHAKIMHLKFGQMWGFHYKSPRNHKIETPFFFTPVAKRETLKCVRVCVCVRERERERERNEPFLGFYEVKERESTSTRYKIWNSNIYFIFVKFTVQ